MSDTATPTTETEREPMLSLVLSTGGDTFTVVSADDTDRDLGRQRLVVKSGALALFIEKRDVPALMNALTEAMFS